MSIIDEKGRVFGRINLVDAIVLAFFLIVIPMFVIAYKAITKEPSQTTPVAIEAPSTYVINVPCPNCGKSNEITIKFGKTITEFLKEHNGVYKAVCPFCKNEVILLKAPEKSGPISYEELYYKQLLEKGTP